MSPAEIARQMTLDKAQVSRALRNLIERKLVASSPHPTDSRRQIIRLTKRGLDASRLVLQAGADRQRRLHKGFSKTEIAELRGYLDRLRANADDMLEPEDT